MKRNIDDLEKYTLKEMFIIITDIIVNEEILDNNKLESCVTHSLILFDHVLNDEEEKYYYCLLDVLEKKKKTYSKEDERRKILNHIKNKLKDKKKIYIISSYDNSPYANIILSWLKDENNYDYIKILLKRIKECYNVRINCKHIIFYILDEYIKNFKMLLENKKSYINKDYIREVYYLFSRDYYIKLSKEEIDEINNIINNFIKYVDKTLNKEKRKRIAKKEIKSLKISYPINVNYYNRRIDDDSLLYDVERILRYNRDNMKKSLPFSKVFLLDNYMYKVEDNKLTMYSINLGSYALKNSIFDSYLKYLEIFHLNMDNFYRKKFSLGVNSSYECIAYTFSFDDMGNVIDFSLGIENIVVDKVVREIDDEELKPFVNLYKIISKKKHIDYSPFQINETFNNLFNKEYFKYGKKNHLPIIYYGFMEINDEKIEELRNECASKLGKLSKEDAYIILDIIERKYGLYFYSMYKEDDMIVDMHLLQNTNYLALLNQRMNYLVLNKNSFDEAHYKRFMEEIGYDEVKIVEELNQSNGYLDQYALKENKGRLVKKIPWK